MNYKTFITTYLGKYVDYDHAYGCQCVDLMRQYGKDVLGVDGYKAIPNTGTAKSIFQNFKNNQYFKKVLNGPKNAPKQGDIIFWGTYLGITGLAGHVSICDSADPMNFISFDQNYPTGNPCRFVKHSYKGVMGWLTRS